MTATQLKRMNTELWQNIGAIADDDGLMRRLAQYTRRLVKEKEKDPTLMSKEEFIARIEEAEREAERGEYSVLLPGEDLTAHLKRLGYDI